MPSIKDVANRAGVSIATVSHVVNNSKYVSEGLRRKVNFAVKELGYEANPIARNMKSKITKTIGVITTDICGLFYPYVLKGIYEETNKKGYNIIIADTNGITDRPSSFKKEIDCFKRMVANRVDGIIFASSVSEGNETSYMKEVQKMININKKIALVSIEQDFSAYGVDSVFSNNFEGAKKATNHLIDVGCKKIGHITGPIYSRVAQDRVSGYKDALQACGLDLNEETMVVNGDYTHQSGYMAARELLSSAPDIDGIYVANDQMAVGVLKALSKLERAVPDDIKIIGYDNVFIASIVEPSLSTIHIRKKNMGIEAAKILLDKIENLEEDSEVRAVEMETQLVIRESTVDDVPEDWILSDW